MDVLLVVVILLLIFGGLGVPQLHVHELGYYPSGILWTIAIICLVVWLVRRNRA